MTGISLFYEMPCKVGGEEQKLINPITKDRVQF